MVTPSPRSDDHFEDESRLDLAESIIGHRFSDRALLRQALTHPSASEDKDPATYYERLEFLGDSVVGFLIAEEVYRRFPHLPEGGMTRIKTSVVSGATLTRVAQDLGLADVLILGQSVVRTGQRGMASALENCYEALTACLFLDAGLEATREWVLRTLGPLMVEGPALSPENPKSHLQEVLQMSGVTPVYRILGHDGPPHERTFTAVVDVAGRTLGEGTGSTKKEAEAAAAAKALTGLQGD